MDPPRVISMNYSSEGRSDCHFRIRADQSVKYITIKAGVLDAESLDDMPLDFKSILPPLDYHDKAWKSAYITRDVLSNELKAALSASPLPGVETIWHPRMIGHLELERTKYLALLAHEYRWKSDSASKTVIAKMARFPWEVQYIEAETRMYQILQGRGIAPGFLGHIHEEGRVIGFLLEKIPDGRNAEPVDLMICESALRRFHALGYVHGDCNKYNFIVRPDRQAVLIDFDKSKPCADSALLEAETASLKSQLAEMTGRGGGLMPFGDGDDED